MHAYTRFVSVTILYNMFFFGADGVMHQWTVRYNLIVEDLDDSKQNSRPILVSQINILCFSKYLLKNDLALFTCRQSFGREWWSSLIVTSCCTTLDTGIELLLIFFDSYIQVSLCSLTCDFLGSGIFRI